MITEQFFKVCDKCDKTFVVELIKKDCDCKCPHCGYNKTTVGTGILTNGLFWKEY